MEETRLLSLIKELDRLTSGQMPDEEKVGIIWEVIQDWSLEDPDKVPSWLYDLLDALVHKQHIPTTEENDILDYGDSTRLFLLDLADVVDMDYIEEGDYYEIQFPTIGLEARISRAGRNYSVQPIE